MSFAAAVEHTLPQLELMAAAAEREQAARDLVLIELIAAGTAAGFGEPTPKQHLKRDLTKIANG